MFGDMRQPFNNAAAEPAPETKSADLEKAQKQHTDLMYANAQLLKAVRYSSIAFVVGAIALISYSYFANKQLPTAAAPQFVPPAGPPTTI